MKIKKFFILATLVASTFSHAGIKANHGEQIQHLKAFKNAKPISDLKEGTKFVMFWASWCGECKVKMANELQVMDKRDDVEVITVNIDKSSKRAMHSVRKNKINLPVYRDESKSIVNKLEVVSVPHWAIYKKTKDKWQHLDSATAYDGKRIAQTIN